MKQFIYGLLMAVTVIGLAIVSLIAYVEHRTALAYKQLSITLSSVTNITVYRWEGDKPQTEITFPVDAFCTTAGHSEHLFFPIAKWPCPVVFNFRDGSTQRGWFDFHSPIFSFNGVPGAYFIPSPWGLRFSEMLRVTMAGPQGTSNALQPTATMPADSHHD